MSRRSHAVRRDWRCTLGERCYAVRTYEADVESAADRAAEIAARRSMRERGYRGREDDYAPEFACAIDDMAVEPAPEGAMRDLKGRHAMKPATRRLSPDGGRSPKPGVLSFAGTERGAGPKGSMHRFRARRPRFSVKPGRAACRA